MVKARKPQKTAGASQERAVVHEVARQVGLHSSEREGAAMERW